MDGDGKGRYKRPEQMKTERGRPKKRQGEDLRPGLSIEPESPDAPECLDSIAKSEWLRITRLLLKIKRVGRIDQQALVMYCTSWSDFCRTASLLVLNKEPLFVLKFRHVPSIYAKQSVAAAKSLITVAREFGLTARTRHLDVRDTGGAVNKLPHELHELRGNPSKLNLKASVREIYLADGWTYSDPPFWFDDDALDCLATLRTQLDSLNLYTPLDHAIVCVAAACYSLIKRCVSGIQEHGRTTEHVKTEISYDHPLVILKSEFFKVLQEIWRDYGMTPRIRAFFNAETQLENEEEGIDWEPGN